MRNKVLYLWRQESKDWPSTINNLQRCKNSLTLPIFRRSPRKPRPRVPRSESEGLLKLIFRITITLESRMHFQVQSVSAAQSSGLWPESRSGHRMDLILGSSEFKSSAALGNSQKVCPASWDS